MEIALKTLKKTRPTEESAGRSFYLNLLSEVEIEAECQLVGVEVETALAGIAHAEGCVVGTLIAEEAEVCYYRELVGEVERYAGTEADVPGHRCVGIVITMVHASEADACATVNEELNEVVARAEVRETRVGVELEHVDVCVGTADVCVLIADCRTDGPLAVEVVAEFRKDCELVGLFLFCLVVLKTETTADETVTGLRAEYRGERYCCKCKKLFHCVLAVFYIRSGRDMSLWNAAIPDRTGLIDVMLCSQMLVQS